jgi:hypothetical protein
VASAPEKGIDSFNQFVGGLNRHTVLHLFLPETKGDDYNNRREMLPYWGFGHLLDECE